MSAAAERLSRKSAEDCDNGAARRTTPGSLVEIEDQRMTVMERASRPRRIDELIVDELLKVLNHLPVEGFLRLGSGTIAALGSPYMFGIVGIRFPLERQFTSGDHDVIEPRHEMLA